MHSFSMELTENYVSIDKRKPKSDSCQKIHFCIFILAEIFNVTNRNNYKQMYIRVFLSAKYIKFKDVYLAVRITLIYVCSSPILVR